jgi:hypothetical protein
MRDFSPLCLAVIAQNEQAVEGLCKVDHKRFAWGSAWAITWSELEEAVKKSHLGNSIGIQQRKKLKRIMAMLKKKNAHFVNYYFISPLLWGVLKEVKMRDFIKYYNPLKGINASFLSSTHKIATLQRCLLDLRIEKKIKKLQEIARQKVKESEWIGKYQGIIVSHYPCTRDKGHADDCLTNDPFFTSMDTTSSICFHKLLVSPTFDVRKFRKWEKCEKTSNKELNRALVRCYKEDFTEIKQGSLVLKIEGCIITV